MQVGEKVEVHTRFTDSWAQGFVIEDVVGDGYLLRRLSDGAVLPSVTGEGDLRPAQGSLRH
ncbi:MAG: hypothetical protein M3503_01190 [Actinomycetota bacterium]|nr:hypothetical protein [Actinomycetota bacterium]